MSFGGEGRTKMIQALLSLGVLLACAVGLAWAFQRSLTYAPDSANPGSAEKWLEHGTDVSLTTHDGLTLSAWQSDPPQRAEYAVLYLPGNGGNRAGRIPIAAELASRGFTTLLLDYRGFGGNPGSPSEIGTVQDAQAALDYLRDSGFADENIVLFGESLGTGVAVQLARTNVVCGLVLRSPFTSMDDVVRNIVKVPVTWILRDHYDSQSTIHEVTAPTTILAGSADRLVPAVQSATLADTAPNLYEYVELPGADHNDDIWFGPFVADQVAELIEYTTTER